MSTLKQKAETILQEKEEKIIPENIKKDISIFNVTGTYEGSSSQTTLPPYYILKKIPFLYINSSGQVKNGDSYVFMVAYNSLKYRCPIISNTGHNEYLKAIVEDSSEYAEGDATIPIRNQLDYYDKILSVMITTNTIPSASYESAYQITTTRYAQTSFDDNIYLEEISTGNIVYFQDVTLWVQNDYNQ